MKMYKVNGFARISKVNAKHRYEAGETIYLCPHELRPGEPWHPETAIVKQGVEKTANVQHFVGLDDDFEKIVRDFEYYNCNLSVGNYPAYYIKEK